MTVNLYKLHCAKQAGWIYLDIHQKLTMECLRGGNAGGFPVLVVSKIL